MTQNTTIKMTPIGGLLLHWEFYHLMPKTQLASYRSDLMREGSKEEFTKLKIYKAMKNGKDIPVTGFDPKATLPPFCYVVGDDGDFRAVVEEKEFEEVKASKQYVLSSKKLNFAPRKWETPVYEIFEYTPAALYVGDSGVYGMDNVEGHDVDNFATVEGFQCPLIMGGSKAESMGLLKPGAADRPDGVVQTAMYDDGAWPPVGVGRQWPDYSGGHGYKFTNYAPQKLCCAYDATRNFLESILGICLDPSDKSWYIADTRVELNGLPLELTLTVLSELVAPYEVEIDKVYLDGFVWSDEIALYSNVLGFEESQIWRMARDNGSLPEGHRVARMMTVQTLPVLKPLIVFAKDPKTAFPTGHAQFYAPRETRPSGWKMALTYRKK